MPEKFAAMIKQMLKGPGEQHDGKYYTSAYNPT